MKKNYDEELHGVELGAFAEDIVTGFRGTVTGLCLYLTGCAQVCLSPRMDDKGEVKDGRWFDITRIRTDASQPAIELIQSANAATRKGAPNGGGENAPIR